MVTDAQAGALGSRRRQSSAKQHDQDVEEEPSDAVARLGAARGIPSLNRSPAVVIKQTTALGPNVFEFLRGDR